MHGHNWGPLLPQQRSNPGSYIHSVPMFLTACQKQAALPPNLMAMASNLIAMASNLEAMASNLEAMASNLLIAMASRNRPNTEVV